MTPEDFRIAGHALIDWIAEYRETLAERPVAPAVRPGEIRAKLPAEPPTTTIGVYEMLAELDRVVLPGMLHTQHPRYFGFFPANATLESVLGDLASTGLGALGLSWMSNPALTEVEEVVCDWMRQLVGLNDQWLGTIQDTASTACLVSLLIARERASNGSQFTGGMQALDQPLTVYASTQAHSSVQKAALLAGFGHDNLREVAVDPVSFDLDLDDLRRQLSADRQAGRVPCAIVACVGSTAATSFDPIDGIVALAREFGCFVHVDAAMAGTAMLLPEQRHLWQGVEGANAVTWNPHKWMGAALDCSLYYVRDRQELNTIMSTNPSYLSSPYDGTVTQYRDWGIPLGRRFRALKLWFLLSMGGVDAIRRRVQRDLDNAAWLAAQVDASPEWIRVAPVRLQTVAMRHEPLGISAGQLEAHTQRWAAALNAGGQCFVTPSLIGGRWAVRVSIGAEPTTHDDVAAVWELIKRSATASSPT